MDSCDKRIKSRLGGEPRSKLKFHQINGGLEVEQEKMKLYIAKDENGEVYATTALAQGQSLIRVDELKI